MEPEQLLNGSRWEVLEQLARKPRSTTELAERIGTSTANVSQQLRQLEIASLVERRRSGRRGVHFTYQIPKEFLYLIQLTPTSAKKKVLSTDPYQHFLIGCLLHPHALAILGLVLGKPELFGTFRAVGVLDRTEPEIFVIADNVDEVRREHASVMIPTRNGKVRLAIWSHTEAELQEGLARKEHYFTTALKDITIMHDPQGLLQRYREEAE